MREYETTFIVQPEISDEGVESLTQRLDAVLENHGSTRLMYDDQGRRRLAYEIQNFQKGRYIALLYLDQGAVVADLERTLRLDDSILRFLTVQVSSEVKDIEARKAAAAEVERIRAEKAAERAQREAEEAERAAQQAEEQAAIAKAASEGGSEGAGANAEKSADEAPAKASGDEAPAKASSDDAPAKATSDDSPAKASGDDATAKASSDDAPAEITEKAANELREA